MAGVKRTTVEARFMSHVEKQGPGCWLWTGYLMPSGYGFFSRFGKNELAHREAHRIFNGSIPDGLDVMHSCDNPSCVNPRHLSPGTRTENMQDCNTKKRHAYGIRHGRAKLKEADVAFARTSKLSQREIGQIIGVSQGHVSAIRTGQRWSAAAASPSPQ